MGTKANVQQHPSSKLVVRFDHRNDTKGTHRYQEQGDADNHKIGSLYVKKSAFEGRTRPDTITVTIE